MEIRNSDVRTVDALGRTRVYEFSTCSEFEVWTMRDGRRQRPEMVVFNYAGSEKKGILSRQNAAYSGYNAHLSNTFGLAASDLAEMLNERRAMGQKPRRDCKR
ncbi:MAG: hypothetical protein GY946_26155 [bacterium]|nr:hypothetical protein [bacterium]